MSDEKPEEWRILHRALEFSEHESVLGPSSWSVSTKATVDNLHRHGYQIVSRDAIVMALCSQALADHLGDVRDAEGYLWEALGAPELPYDDPAWDSAEAWPVTAARLKAAGIPLPIHLRDCEDDDE